MTPPKRNNKRKRTDSDSSESIDSGSDSDSTPKFPDDLIIFAPSDLLNLLFDEKDDNDTNTNNTTTIAAASSKRKKKTCDVNDPFDTYYLDLPSFVPSIENVQTLQDLIVIGKEFLAFADKHKLRRSARRHSSSINHHPPTTTMIAPSSSSDSPPPLKKRKVGLKNEQNYMFHKLSLIISDLESLDTLLGMKDLKQAIVHQIMYFLQDLQERDMMHSILSGAPGTGKTTVAKMLGEIYRKIGLLKTGEFKIATRNDFIAKYLGQTANKTKRFLDSCLGNVLFIDEAYSLGPQGGEHDMFSKEAIDTLTQFLSEHSHEFICLIAGYEDCLKDSFFCQNPGLERRFTWKFTMDSYTCEQLEQIFCRCVTNNKWTLTDDCDVELKLVFCARHNYLFTNSGGDCEILFNKCKVEHSRRLFLCIDSMKRTVELKTLNSQDIHAGFEQFKLYKRTLTNNSFNSMFS